MSHELPSAGEFARVVSGCPCGFTNDCLGLVELVVSVSGSDWACECQGCGTVFYGAIAKCAGDPPDESYPLHWLRRIPPPGELLDEIEREAIPA